ncbi:MAG: PAS domain-containing protein [Actinomycetota bacterium]
MTWQALPARFISLVVRPTTRPVWVGIVVACAFIVGELAVINALKLVAPDNAFGALLLLGVLVVSAGWGYGLAIAMSMVSAVVYTNLHLEGRDSLVPAVAVFLTLALLTNLLVGQARVRAAEAVQRRREADLAAALARIMLRAPSLQDALDGAGQRLAQALGLPWATLRVGETEAAADQTAIPLRDGTAQSGTLLIPRGVPLASVGSAQRMVPSLQALLAAACDRETITAELEASRRELERFFAVASDLLFLGEGDYLTRVNPAFERTLGYSAAELAARPLPDFIHPDDRDATAAAWAAIPPTDGAAQFESRCLCRDGGVRWLEWNIVSDRGVLVGGARDVTERRLEQDRLRVARAQQAALRRVATLVARGAPLRDVYDAAVAELAHSLGAQHVTLLTFDTDEAAVVQATVDTTGNAGFAVGERLLLDGDSIAARVRRTGAPARMASYAGVDGSIAARLRGMNVSEGAGAPIVIEESVRGALVVAAHSAEGVVEAAETHIGDFADLISTAIANAETRSELKASRARLVAAADEARRRFERDLHDGAQQRIVSLSLELRSAEAALAHDDALRAQLSHAVEGLAGLHSDLQELSRGLHPAVLSRGGLGPAMRNLARRSTVPVDLTVDVGHRLPESVEVAAYYVVAEALTNIAKHANAEGATVQVELLDGAQDGARVGEVLQLCVSDDGDGGADTSGGSGLMGLRDRVEALSGTMTVQSRPGDGTQVTATIPIP